MTIPERRADPSAGASSRGRRLGGLLVLVPLAVGLLYAAASALFEGSPTLREMVPEDAIEVQRYRNLAAYDSVHAPPDAPGKIAPKASAILGAELNLPGLPGIDPQRPLLVTTLPAQGRASPDVYVLPVTDRGAARDRFFAPDFAERHARHLDFHGSWAALGWDRDAVKRAGSGGGLWAEDRGEDWCRVADWPRVVEFALLHAKEQPIQGILASLGYDDAHPTTDAQGQPVVQWGRVPIVWHAWKTVTLYGWADRLRAELVPADGSDLAKALADAKASPHADSRAAARLPFDTEAVLSCYGAHGRRVVALALRDAGVAFPETVRLESFRLDAPGSLLAWADLAPGALPTWTVGMAAPPAAVPDLQAFGLPAPAAGESRPFTAGAASINTPYGGGGTGIAGSVGRAGVATLGVDVVAFGVDGETAAKKMAALLESPNAEPAPNEKGTVLLARFRLAQVPAIRLLGGALSPGGILSPVSGGAIEGTLSTDGTRLILEAGRAR